MRCKISLAAVIVAVAIAGCGSSSSNSSSKTGSGGSSASKTTASSGAPASLRLVFNNSSEQAMNAAIASFHAAHPNITVNATYVDGSSIAQTLLPELRAGSPPDLFQTQPTTPIDTDTLGKAGSLLDLSGQPWTSTLDPVIKPWVSAGGKTYGLPLFADSSGLAFNVAMMKKLGLSVPTSFSQLLAMCPKISATGKTPIANGFSGSLVTGIVMGEVLTNEFVYNQVPNWDKQRAAGKVTFSSSPQWRNAFNAVLQMKNAGCFGKAAEGITLPEESQEFATGQAPMSILAAPQIAGALQINPKLDIELANFPAANPSQTVAAAAVSQVLSVSAKTTHSAAATEFVNYLSTGPGAAALAKAGLAGLTPAQLQGQDVPAYAAPLVPSLKAHKLLLTLHAYPNPTMLVGPSGIAGGITGLITGQDTVSQVLKNLDYLWAHPTATAAP